MNVDIVVIEMHSLVFMYFWIFYYLGNPSVKTITNCNPCISFDAPFSYPVMTDNTCGYLLQEYRVEHVHAFLWTSDAQYIGENFSRNFIGTFVLWDIV